MSTYKESLTIIYKNGDGHTLTSTFEKEPHLKLDDEFFLSWMEETFKALGFDSLLNKFSTDEPLDSGN